MRAGSWDRLQISPNEWASSSGKASTTEETMGESEDQEATKCLIGAGGM